MDNTINENKYIRLNGIEQFISINGKNSEQPLIIFLHGGPGAAYGTRSYIFKEWFKHFNVVFWDQPGAGRTAIKNPDFIPTFEYIIDSLKSLIEYLKRKFNKEKIGIIARSWGTVPGLYYVNHFPKDILFYCGTGQLIDTQKDEHVVYQELHKRLLKEKNAEGLKKLSELGKDYPGKNLSNIREKLDKFHQYIEDYGMFFENSNSGMSKKEELLNSPIYIPEDLTIQKRVSSNQDEIFKFLGMFSAYNYSLNYRIPFCLILGQKDWVVPVQHQINFFNDISAPKKELVLLENAGHKAMTDQPKEFLKALINFIQSTHEADSFN